MRSPPQQLFKQWAFSEQPSDQKGGFGRPSFAPHGRSFARRRHNWLVIFFGVVIFFGTREAAAGSQFPEQIFHAECVFAIIIVRERCSSTNTVTNGIG